MRFVCLSGLFLAASVGAQELTLEEALKLALERNGTLRAARLDLIAADAQTKQAKAAFFPTVTPSFEYRDSRIDQFTGVPAGFSNRNISSGATTDITASWKLLDSGFRSIDLRSSQALFDAQAATSLGTLRNVLFDVVTQYYDVLRNSELVKVQDAQVERAGRALDQILAQIRVGDAAEKDKFQPQADQANAVVNRLAARTRFVRAESDFKATIGWSFAEPLEELVPYQQPTDIPNPPPLEDVVSQGLINRPDLASRRAQIRANELQVQRVRLGAGVSYSIDASFTKQFGKDNLNNRLLSLTASFPLFDGRRSAEAVREAKANLDSARALLLQAEREARSEIESAWRELSLNTDRVTAAKSAFEAARVNYEFVQRARSLQAATVVEESTASVTLVTAQTNLVEALFDYAISQVRIRLVTGQPLPGEESPVAGKN